MAPMHVNQQLSRGGDPLAPSSRDRGVALVMAVIVSVVVLALGGSILSYANHQSTASRSDGQRQQTIDFATASLSLTDLGLTANKDYAPPVGVQPYPGGGAEFEVVIDPDPAHRVIGAIVTVTSTVYVPTKAAAKTTRTMQQQLVLDPKAGAVGGGFKYAVYTTGNLETKSPVLCSTTLGPCPDGSGGIFSVGHVSLLANGAVYSGDVTTTSNITTGQNDTIYGTLNGCGTVSINGTASHVYGNAFACGGIIPIDGTLHGNAFAGGGVLSNQGGCTSANIKTHVTGTCKEKSGSPPQIVPPVQPNPFFTWNPANYPTGVTGPMAGSAFVTATNKKDVKGVYWISSGRIDYPSNGELWLTGDLTIYSPSTTISLPPVVLNKAGKPIQLSVIVLNGISDSGSFTVPADVKVLLYGGTGSISLNSATSAVNRPLTGVAYNRAGSVTFGANSSFTFAPVEAIGFNFPENSGGASTTTTYTIRSISTREINSTP